MRYIKLYINTLNLSHIPLLLFKRELLFFPAPVGNVSVKFESFSELFKVPENISTLV